MTSAIACAMRVDSWSRCGSRSGRPFFSWRLATTVSRSALPVRSPYPLTVPCTWVAPASTAAIELATAQPVSLWQWMPIRAPVAAHDVVHDVGDLVGQHPAVGVAQGDHLGAGLGGDAHGLEGVVAVRRIPVEEVLGVEEDPPALGAQERDGVADHLEVLRERRAQGPLDVAGVRLGDEGDDLRLAVEQGAHERVAVGAAAGPAGGAEGRERRVAQGQVARGAGEELGVLGVGPGPAALDEADAELVEVRGDGELVAPRRG